MQKYVIVFHGDNTELHRKALEAAVEAAAAVNKTPAYRAYLDGHPNEHTEGTSDDQMSDWRIDFRRNTVLGTWSWSARWS